MVRDFDSQLKRKLFLPTVCIDLVVFAIFFGLQDMSGRVFTDNRFVRYSLRPLLVCNVISYGAVIDIRMNLRLLLYQKDLVIYSISNSRL